jgi:dTDP-glucose pyrophosphorylase
MPVISLNGCGFYALNPDFFDAVARTPRTALRDEYELTVALELYRDSGKPLYAEELPLRWDTNLTRPEDLLDCNLQWLGCLHRSELVGPDADVQQGARLERVVVGNHARVTKNCDLQDVVVFSGACVDSAEPIRNALVTPERSYLLNHPQPVRV